MKYEVTKTNWSKELTAYPKKGKQEIIFHSWSYLSNVNCSLWFLCGRNNRDKWPDNRRNNWRNSTDGWNRRPWQWRNHSNCCRWTWEERRMNHTRIRHRITRNSCRHANNIYAKLSDDAFKPAEIMTIFWPPNILMCRRKWLSILPHNIIILRMAAQVWQLSPVEQITWRNMKRVASNLWTVYITLTYLVFLLKQKLQCIVTLNIQETCHFLIILEELTVQECRLWLSHYLKNYSIVKLTISRNTSQKKKKERIKIDIKDCNESLYLWNTTAMSIHLLNKVVCRGNQELIKGPQKKRHFSNHNCVTAQKNYRK